MSDDLLGLEKTREAKRRVLEVLKEMPVVAVVCRKVGIGRATYYRWQNEDPSFRFAVREAFDLGISYINDMSEMKLVSLINEGRMPAITLWLKHHHHRYDRGDSRREWNEQEKKLGLVALIEKLSADDENQDT